MNTKTTTKQPAIPPLSSSNLLSGPRREFWRIKVDATGEEQEFDRLEDVAGWRQMVTNTFMDPAMTFTVTHVVERQFKM